MRRRSLSLSLLPVSALVVAFTALALAAGTTPVPTGNLTANPSFETNANGWGPWQATLTRTALTDAPNGSYAMKVARASGTFYTIDDTPDTVPSVTGGTKYTATAYVKAAVTASVGKPIRIVVRERKVVNGAVVKETSSTAVNLTTAFQKITVTHTGVKSGEAVDMYVQQDGAVSGSAFYADLISLTADAAAPPPDTQAPTVPAGLTLGAVTATSAPLSWTAATDNVGVTGYQVSLNGVAGATVTGHRLHLHRPDLRHQLHPGGEGPRRGRQPLGRGHQERDHRRLPGHAGSLGAHPAHRGRGHPDRHSPRLDGLDRRRRGHRLPGLAQRRGRGHRDRHRLHLHRPDLRHQLHPGGEARDAAGNLSAAATASVATSACPIDDQPPTVPTALSVGTPTATSLPLSWSAATDNVAVTGYQVSLNGVDGATSPAPATPSPA